MYLLLYFALFSLAQEKKIVANQPVSFLVTGYEVDPWVMIDLGTAVVHLSLGSARTVFGAEELLAKERISQTDYERFVGGMGDQVAFSRCSLVSRTRNVDSTMKGKKFTVQMLIKELEEAQGATAERVKARYAVKTTASCKLQILQYERYFDAMDLYQHASMLLW